MKKELFVITFSIVLSCYTSLCLAACSEGEVLGTVSGNCIPSNGSCGTGCSYVIDSVGNLKVTGNGASNAAIKADFFKNNKDIITAEIDGDIKSMGKGAFQGASSMISIKIAEGVTSISYNEFRDCSSLKSLKLPNSLKSVDTRFLCANCSNLEELYVPDHAYTSLGESMFSGTKITDFQIPETVTQVEHMLVNTFESIGLPIVLPESVNNVKFSFTLSPTLKTKVFCSEVQIENKICAESAYKYVKEGNLYKVYDPDGSLLGVYENYASIAQDSVVDSYEKYDDETGILTKYDGRGGMLSYTKNNEDGSVYMYDKDRKLKMIQGKKIYTVEEATTLTNNNGKNKNTFSIRYR